MDVQKQGGLVLARVVTLDEFRAGPASIRAGRRGSRSPR